MSIELAKKLDTEIISADSRQIYKEFDMTSDEFATTMLKSKKVCVVPGTAFGNCGEGFLRISYAYSMENLKIAMDRFEEFVKELRESK